MVNQGDGRFVAFVENDDDDEIVIVNAGGDGFCICCPDPLFVFTNELNH